MVDFVKLKKDDKSDERPKKKAKFSFKKFAIIILVLFLLSSIISSISYSVSPKVAVIPIKGTITSESSYSILDGESISSRDIASTIRSVADDETYRGILLDINSGGGSAVASEEISEAIKYAKQKIPVYAYTGDIAASGAFWIGVSADKVYSSRMTILGSIGVTMATLSFEEFIKEYNITYRSLTAGEYKDIGSTFREMRDEEKEILQSLLDETHDVFITHVAESRNLDKEFVSTWAEGQVFSGTKAKELGFIDQIGLYEDALRDLKNGSSVIVVDYTQTQSLFGSMSVESPSIFSKSNLGLMLK